jgi:hypothetical protein
MARPKKGVPTKSDFVRAMPADMPAKDIVAAAAKKGMKLGERYVYVIRSADNARARKGLPARGTRGRGRAARANGSEAALRRAIAELGLSASRRILQDVEAQFSR